MSAHQLIAVTQKHIDSGMPSNSAKCMVAEAVKDAIPGAKKVHADMQTIRYTDDKGIRRTFLTGASPQSALVRYDAGDAVQPFSFRLPDPIHINKPTVGTTTGALKTKLVVANANSKVGARVGGRGIPVLGNATRRRFGIRNLRINQQGQVVQIGTDTPVE